MRIEVIYLMQSGRTKVTTLYPWKRKMGANLVVYKEEEESIGKGRKNNIGGCSYKVSHTSFVGLQGTFNSIDYQIVFRTIQGVYSMLFQEVIA